MACSSLDSALPRISGRTGQIVDLKVDFYQGGVLADPFAIRYVEIYRTSVAPHNLVTTIPFVAPDDILYPAPACQVEDATSIEVGRYHLLYDIPTDSAAPDVYYDVWYYYPTNPCPEEEVTDGGTDTDGTEGTAGTDVTVGTDVTDSDVTGEVTACDIDDEEFASQLMRCCHQFWVYPNEWFCTDQLRTLRFGFEPLDVHYHYPELRPLEIGLMPLPLYDFNYNFVTAIIPMLQPTISIETQHCELLVDGDLCSMGLRQGSYRTNPWVIRYNLDTSLFLKGTYRYQITLPLPDGTTRVSQKFIFTIR